MRHSLVCIGVALAFFAGGCVVQQLGGASSSSPANLQRDLSDDAKALLRAAHEGIDPERLVDYHTHVVGLGTGGTGTWVNPVMRSWWHPLRRFTFAVYASAAGIDDVERADELYLSRLLELARTRPVTGRYHILAFDHHYARDGARVLEHSEFYVPNEYVFALAEAHPDVFIPVMSIHPYRRDAIPELERFVARGGRMLKWLPNAMGIDPADPAIDGFYSRLRELDVTLLSHAGEEKAVEADDAQELGNPLRLRRALDHGVKVIVAHCASLGENIDLDDPAARSVPSFELFMRMLGEQRYVGSLFGEVSAMIQANRVGEPLTTILDRTDLHGRLVNGSDYPLPAINVVIRTGTLVRGGYLTEREAELLDEIYDFNPLLFDFVTKRTIRSPRTRARLSAGVFHALVPSPP